MGKFKKDNSLTNAANSEWHESEHPRDGDGKFAQKNSGAVSRPNGLTSASNSETGAADISQSKPIEQYKRAPLTDETKMQIARSYPAKATEWLLITSKEAASPTININTPERLKYRVDKANEYYDVFGAVKKERKAFILIGGPAAGKSTVAKDFIKNYGAMELDSDIIKEGRNGFEGIPEYGDGRGVSKVHEESSTIADMAFKKAIANGDNLVYPKVGGNAEKIRDLGAQLKAAGYRVNLVYNDLPIEKAAQRNLTRFEETGRLVPIEYLIEVGNNPYNTYIELKNNKEAFDGHAAYDSDVAKGQSAKTIESNIRV